MRLPLSATLQSDLMEAAQKALAQSGIINVPFVAEEVRRRNVQDNVALEDIEAYLLSLAQRLNAVVEFDHRSSRLPSLSGGDVSAAMPLSAPQRD